MGTADPLQHLSALLGDTADAVVAMDERYVVTVWNRGAERLYGWSAAEVVGRSAHDVATFLSDEEVAELRRELAEQGRWRGELAATRKDATPIHVELISVALHGEQQNTTGYLTIHRDISERKRTEDARPAPEGRQRDRAAVASLTPRQIEILQSLADGLDSHEIAKHLFISIRTVQNHVANILAKLNVHCQLQALVLAIRYDVVEVV
jgi:PAS domain S-box-containing protein